MLLSCSRTGLTRACERRLLSRPGYQPCRHQLAVHTRAATPESENSPLAVCSSAVQQLMQTLSSGEQGRLDSLLEYVPDSLIDKCIEARKASGSHSVEVCFDDIRNLLRAGDFAQTSDLLFDSYAMRLLVFETPSSTCMLSSLMPSDVKCVHRVLVKSGQEEAVLTLNMQLQEGLISQYRSAPRISSAWRLVSVTGESSDPTDIPTEAGPSVSPECVVQAQLEALRQGNIAGVYEFASPMNKAATGPLEKFSRLFEHPMYKPLLGLEKAESLKKVQLTPETYAEVVGVVSSNTGVGRSGKFVYVWSVGRVLPEQSPEQANFWMTNSVQLVSATDASMWAPPAE